MLSGLRGSVVGAISCGVLGLCFMGAMMGTNAPAADPLGGPDLAPPNPESVAPSLPPVGGVAPAQAGDEQGGEALTRGAIHEAFAEPFDANPKPTTVVPRKPPEPIDEVAPDVKPDGDNVEWIPGYWGWDDDREDFVWISGLWRKIPPGRRWVPGYWVDEQGGFRWVSGMWAEDRVQELNYLPAPPDSLDQGPNVAAPSDDYFWIPGCWVYGNTGYRWRAGYWSLGQNNWIWSPARYVWSPRGCFFVPGYWDYAFARRGVLFSPVYFRPAIYRRPAFVYSPSVVVSLGGISSHLFVGVGFGHYYFGDYYGDGYFRRGYQPWYSFHGRRYDPCLTYYSWYHRRNDKFDYVRRLEDRHNHFVKNTDLRPPRTYLAQRDWERRVGDTRARETGELGRSLRDVQNRRDNDRDNNVRFVKVADTQRREIEQHRTQLRDLSSERSKLEKVAGDARVHGNNPRPGDGRAPGAGGRGPGGEASRGDTPRLKLPQTIGAEQRAATDRRRDNTPGTGGEGTDRRGVGAVPRTGEGTDRKPGGGRGDGAGRGENGERANIGQPSTQPRDGQPRTGQPRDGQIKDGQPKDGQIEDGQPRTIQPRGDQPRDTQPRNIQPRDNQPRSIQPRSIQPRDSQPRDSQPRDIQPRGGNSGSRDSQPRGQQPRGGGSSRERGGRASVTDEAPPVVTKPRQPAVIAKPNVPPVVAPREKITPPVVRQETKPAPIVRSRDSVETRLKPPVDNSTRERSGAAPSTRSTRGSDPTAPRITQPSVPPRVRSTEPSSRGGGKPEVRSDSGRSSGEARGGRSGSSDTKAPEKEEEKKTPPSGRGRGR